MMTRKRRHKSRSGKESTGQSSRGRSEAQTDNLSRFVTKSWAVTSQVLSQRRDSLAVLDLMGFFYWLGDQNIELIKKGLPRVPCAIGCSYCCHVRAGLPDLLPLEAFCIAEFLRSSNQMLLAPARACLDSFAADERQVLQRAEDESTRSPCLFLAQNRCLIYPVRPLRCRAQYSPDAEACRQNFLGQRDTIPLLNAPALLYESLRIGMRLGLKEVRLYGHSLGFQGALSIAWKEPDALERWFSGEPVFEDARLLEEADEAFIKTVARQCKSQVGVERKRLQKVIAMLLEEPGTWSQRSGLNAKLQQRPGSCPVR
jgi:hypothetical protein